MTTIPRLWANDTNYSSGPASGTPTKEDPGAALAAQGWIPGPVGAQHLNHELNQYSRLLRSLQTTALLQPRLISDTVTDGDDSMGACTLPSGAVLAVKVDAARWISRWDHPETFDPPTPIDADVTDVATNGAGLCVAVGADGSDWRFSTSTDDGVNWVTGDDLTIELQRIVWSERGSQFVASARGTGSHFVFQTADGDIPVNSANTGLGTDLGGGGIAVLNAGASDRLVVCGALSGAAGRPAFRISDDGGATWSAGSQFGAGVYEDIGTLDGNGGSLIYHAGTLTGNASIVVSSSANGTSWSSLVTIAAPAGFTFNDNPRVLVDDSSTTSALIWVVSRLVGESVVAVYVIDASNSLVLGPRMLPYPSSLGIEDAFAAAGGRLLCTRGVALFASDGL